MTSSATPHLIQVYADALLTWVEAIARHAEPPHKPQGGDPSTSMGQKAAVLRQILEEEVAKPTPKARPPEYYDAILARVARIIEDIIVRSEFARVGGEPLIIGGQYLTISSFADRLRAELGTRTLSVPIRRAATMRVAVPAQAVGPVQFKLENGILSIAHQRAVASPPDRAVAGLAKDTLESVGVKLISDLEETNCDRAIINAIADVQDALTSLQDVVKLGILNLGLGDLREMYRRELPNAVLASMNSYTRGIAMYVAQFPDWARFVENAASVDFTELDRLHLYNRAAGVVGELKKRPDLVDPEVPSVILLLRELIKTPGRANIRAIFAVLRTLENLSSFVLNHVGAFFDDFVTQTRTGLAKWGSRALIAYLISAAVEAMGALTDLVGRVPGLSWVDDAHEIAEQLREELGDLESEEGA